MKFSSLQNENEAVKKTNIIYKEMQTAPLLQIKTNCYDEQPLLLTRTSV